jgi:hypothetical protein
MIGLQMFAAPQASAAGCTWVYAGTDAASNPLHQGTVDIFFDTMSLNNGQLSARVTLVKWDSKRDVLGWRLQWVPLDSGDAKGSIVDNRLSFVIAWSSGAKGDYQGWLDIYGNVKGTTVDLQHRESTAEWVWAGFSCVPIVEPATSTPESSAPPLPFKRLGKRRIPKSANKVPFDVTGAGGGGLAADVAPQAPAQPPQQTAKAIDDVDVYDGPDGDKFKVIGMMQAESSAPVLGHEVNWYKLQLNVPGGSGWVAEDHLKIKP